MIQLIYMQDIFLRTLAITWMMHIIFIGGVRFAWRMYSDTYRKVSKLHKRALIIGAGASGTLLAKQLRLDVNSELNVVAFLDDDHKKHNLVMLGVPIVGGTDDIALVVNKLEIEHIIIAMPSVSKSIIKQIVTKCKQAPVKVQILPNLEDLVSGKVSINDIRDVDIEDLLGREPVELDLESIAESITGKVVLVTGAGGSIGSEICRQVSNFNPSTLILLGHGENSIYSIEIELLNNNKDRNIQYYTEIADIQDQTKMLEVMMKYKPSVIYHAAAHKHVPLMERNPEAAVKNNIIGTKNVAEAASICGVETFVMISTDKAVNPTSVMGASKRIAEMIIQHMDAISETRFVAVRFGNVLGSRGSVIPLFKEQIKQGGPITVTHPDMIRYFMTIPEASRLVLQAGTLAKGGEIFVLDMGEPVKIVDLANNLIRLSGYTEEEIEIQFTGIRPGEKMFEELLNENEIREKQVYPKIYVGRTAELFIDEINEIINDFYNIDSFMLRQKLLELAINRETSREFSIAK